MDRLMQWQKYYNLATSLIPLMARAPTHELYLYWLGHYKKLNKFCQEHFPEYYKS